jgi:4-hydroxy-3-methylbut-2-enyl diphosphate reductase
MELVLAQPRGFCAGVTRAIDTVERALARHGAPVYVFHEIVHNQWVVDDLRQRGAVFVEALSAVPAGAVVVFSAHGVAQAVVDEAGQRRLRAIDATCPLVSKVHQQAQRFARQGRRLIMIGHAGHEEVVGTTGRVHAPVALVAAAAEVASLDLPVSAPAAYVTQTTLSLDDARETIAALQARFPDLAGPDTDDICYATQNRQNAVHALAREVDRVLVVGARNSSNSNRLREVAERAGVPARLVQDATEIDHDWLLGARRVGITSGASTPELLVEQVIDALRARGARAVTHLGGVREDVSFRLPADLAV